MKKFLLFLIILLIAAWFIAVNAGTRIEIVLFFPEWEAMRIKNIPLGYFLLASFLLGVVVTLAFSLFRSRKKPEKRPAPDFQSAVPQEAASSLKGEEGK
jgi:uncharacterized integral membrane protein